MKKICSILCVMILVLGVFTSCGNKSDSDKNGTANSNVSSEMENNSGSSSDSSSAVDNSVSSEGSATSDNSGKQADANLLTGKHHVQILVKKYGKINVELDADVAPISVTNFEKLAKKGFYNGLTFHRIIDGFMIQGGDPNGDGTGGSDETIKGEFSENGVENSISHVRGTISMARSQDNDSASSQFFIVQSDSLFLDGQYAGFGTVTKGMDIVDKICKDTPVTDSNGTVETANQPVITKIKVID